MAFQKTNLNFPPLTGLKRPRLEFESLSQPVFDRFFKISLNEGSFKNTSPFLIHRALQSTFGTLSDTRKMSDGSILIEVSNDKQSEIAAKLNKLLDFDVTASPHKTLNTVKGIISCQDLANCTDDEILENLKEQGVIEIYRLPGKKDSSIPSHTFIISFKLHQLPSKIHAGWYALRVRPYIPSPMRCFNCQRFGHTAAKCSFNSLCPSCGHNKHSDIPCVDSPICINCSDKHSPRYKGCHKYRQEFEIQKLRTLEKISYFEAKKKFFASQPQFSSSFSMVTKGTRPRLVSTAIQCDMPTSTSPSPNPHHNTSSLPPPNLSFPPPPSLPFLFTLPLLLLFPLLRRLLRLTPGSLQYQNLLPPNPSLLASVLIPPLTKNPKRRNLEGLINLRLPLLVSPFWTFQLLII